MSFSRETLFSPITRFMLEKTNNSTETKSPTGGSETYEFIAFTLWYIFLVLCCVVPTCCAYRRRRMVEARMAQQQMDLQNRLQQPNLFLLESLAGQRQYSQRHRQWRTEKLNESLRETTTVLRDSNFEGLEMDEVNTGPSDVEQPAATAKLPSSDCAAGEEWDGCELDHVPRVKLPPSCVNADRTVCGLCAICLCPYEPNEELSWSPLPPCQHAFHTECIKAWLAKEIKCPICRQDFCRLPPNDEWDMEDIFLDSFALALNYARSQAARNWIATAQADLESRGTSWNHHATVEEPRGLRTVSRNPVLSRYDSRGSSFDHEPEDPLTSPQRTLPRHPIYSRYDSRGSSFDPEEEPRMNITRPRNPLQARFANRGSSFDPDPEEELQSTIDVTGNPIDSSAENRGSNAENQHGIRETTMQQNQDSIDSSAENHGINVENDHGISETTTQQNHEPIDSSAENHGSNVENDHGIRETTTQQNYEEGISRSSAEDHAVPREELEMTSIRTQSESIPVGLRRGRRNEIE